LSEKFPTVNVVAPREMLVGIQYGIKVTVKNLNSEFASSAESNYKFKPSLLASYELPKEIDVSKDIIVPFTPKESGDLNIVIELGGITASVNNIDVRVFSDMTSSDADLKAVSYLKNKGIISGYDDGSFRPENNVTRAEAVKILASIVPVGSEDLGSLTCSDVPVGVWFKEYFEKAYDFGAVAPSENNTCRPLEHVNGYEYLKMLMTRVDVDPQVDDVYSSYFDTDAWFAPYLQEAVERNIITAGDVERFADPLSRRDIAELTYRFLKVAETSYEVFS
jgi:hypothetical protein